MKKWFLFTGGLYLLILSLLAVPTVMIAGISYSKDKHIWFAEIPFREALQIYKAWGYWVWVAVVLACQTLLLFVPIAAAERRPVRRRHVGFALGATTFLLANLALAGLFALGCGIFGDDAVEPIRFLGEKSSANPVLTGILAFLHLPSPGPAFMSVLTTVGLLFTFWGVWFLIFYRYGVANDATSILNRGTRWLIRGSILELLVAVPSHIIVRGRGDCCAPMATFWGMAAGISVMLLAFGPAVFFLFARRIQQLRPRPPSSHP